MWWQCEFREVWCGRDAAFYGSGRSDWCAVLSAEIGEEIALLNERILQAALQGALGVG